MIGFTQQTVPLYLFVLFFKLLEIIETKLQMLSRLRKVTLNFICYLHLSFQSQIKLLSQFISLIDVQRLFVSFELFVHKLNLLSLQMLVKKLVPFKFLTAVLEIAIAGVLLSTNQRYPTLNGTSQTSFVVGCIMIIVFVLFQIILTMVGINIYDRRIHFENLILNLIGFSMMIWFALALWQREYIWYIWGFLTVYPFANETVGLISVMCHNKKIIFEKYRINQ